MMFAFSIPGEPTGKGRPKFSRVGSFTRVYTPEKTAKYENWVKCCFMDKYPIGTFPLNISNPIQMEMAIYMSIPQSTNKKNREAMMSGQLRPTKKPDIDNVLKIVADSLNGIAYRDDSQIVMTKVQKLYSDSPRVVVLMKEI